MWPLGDHWGQQRLEHPLCNVRGWRRRKAPWVMNLQAPQQQKGMNGAAFEEMMLGWRAAGPPSHQGNTGSSHKELPFPTQSDGRKVKKPGDAKCWKGQGARADGRGGHSLGDRSRGRRSSQEPGCAPREGGTDREGAYHSSPCNNQEKWFWGGNRAGAGELGLHFYL